MYWGDFRSFVRENALPWRSIKYYKSKQGFVDTFSICDFHLPRRKGVKQTGHHAEDWYRDSYVCNVSVFEGHVPFENAIDVWNEAELKWETKPARGAKSALAELMSQGVCERNEQTESFLRNGAV